MQYNAKVTSKGQVTIPKQVREELGLEPGSSITFELNGAGKAAIWSPLQVMRSYYGTVPLPPGMTGTDLADKAEEIWTEEALKRFRRSRGE